MMPVKRLSLTDLTAKIPKAAREKTLKKALKENGTMEKWSECSWAKKLKVQVVRKNMTDFDRFKLYKVPAIHPYAKHPRAARSYESLSLTEAL